MGTRRPRLRAPPAGRSQVCQVIVGFHVLRVDVTLDLGFHVVIGVGRLIVRFHHAYAIQVFFLMLLSDFVLSSLAIILACCTSRKRVL